MGIVYRDLKSENVLLSAEGHVKLTDFGLSKQLVGDTTHTMCGTPDYVAPEVLSKEGHTESIDWWALGILLYEMYTKRTPFQGMDLVATLKFLKSRRPICLDSIKGASPQFQNLVALLLERDPTKRLGATRGAQELMEHSFFAQTNWVQVS